MRGKNPKKRDIQPDPIYGSILVTKLINNVMMHGKRKTAEKIVYAAMEILGEKTKTKPLDALQTAYQNVSPRIEVRSKRIGGGNYQVPVPVREERQQALATRWILQSARSSRGKGTFAESLARELVGSFNGDSNSVKKKEEVKRMAEANKAFAQFA